MGNQDSGTGRPYERPVLRQIDLAADEVMAAGCKTVSRTGPSTLNPPCAPCMQIGS
ncbi:MAG: hypothetical protein OHK006_19900 [Thermodesulfovibrionales bacterium]